MTRREKMNRINEVLMSMISAAYGWPIMLMIDDIKSLDYASLYFVVWALDRGCATIYTERISITDKGTNHHSPGDDTTKVAAFGNVAGASMSVTRRSENPRDDIASHSTSSDGGPLSMLDLSGTARNEDISALRHKLYEAEGQRIIRLEPMTRPQHDRLLNYLFLYDVDPDLSGKLYVKTGGIPGFTAQICANLIEGNHVSVRNAQVVLAKKGRLEEKAVHFVKGLEAHVLTLVESLPEEARVGLHVCAVLQIDGTFEYAVFKAMMERLSEDPDSALRVLMQANLIVQTLVNRDRPPHSDDVQPVSPPLPKSTANDADRRSKGSRASTPMMPGDRQSPTAMLPVQMYCPSTSMDALNEDGLRSGGERHLIFTQQLARDAIYLTLLQSVRKQYHSSAADIIVEQERDQQCGQRKALTSQRLFYHLSRSGKNTPFRYCYSAFIAAIGSNKIDIAMNYLDSVSDGGTTLTAYEEVMYFFNKLACVNEMGREEDFLEPSNTDSVIEGVQQFQAKERSTRKVPGGDARRAPQRKGAGKRGFFACCCGGGEAEDPHEAYLDGMENSSLGRGNSELSMRNVGGDDEVISQRYGADLHQDMYASLSAYSGKPLTSSSPRTGDPAKKLGPHATDAVAKQEVVVLFYTLLAELRFAKGDKAQVSAAVARVADAQRALARMDYSAGSSVLGLNPQESALEMDVKFLIDEKSRTAQARQARSTSSNRLTTTCMFGAMSAFKFPDILRLLSQHGYTSQHNMHKTLVQLPGLHKRPQEPIMLVVHGKFRLSLHGLMRSMQVVGYILQGDSANAKGCIDELRECGSPKWSLSALHLKSIARGFMLVDGLGGYATNKLTLLSKMQKAGLSALATETQASMLSGCGFADIVMEVLHTACTKSEVSLATALEDLEKQAGIATPHLGLAVLSVVDRIAAQVSNPSGVTPPAVNLPSPPERKLSGPPNADMLQRAVKLLKRVAEWFPVFEPCALLYEGIAPAGKQPVLQRFEDCIVAASRYGMKGSIFVWRARTHLLLARTLQEEHLSSITDLLASYTKNGFHSPAEYSALEAAELGLKNS